MTINFNKPYCAKTTIDNILDVFDNGVAAGDGKYTKLCNKWFEDNLKTKRALLTHSCTAALEMSAILAEIGIGDEVIMPSFTFVSTANAFVLRGATPVFIDIRADNCNIDESLIESAITSKTKAIVPVHYAGVACDMDKIMKIAKKHNLIVIEDAAQALGSLYKGKPLGTIGDIGTLSFHETKNVISGEGGAILINNSEYIERAEIIREKGTNRSKFFRGQVDKYTWVDIGSSYLPSDIIAAYLYSGLEILNEITEKRQHIWNKYNNAFKEFSKKRVIKTPVINDYSSNNAHMFYIMFHNTDIRNNFINHLKDNGIIAPFHYIPLHSSPAGRKFGRYIGDMKNTNITSDTLVRLPLFYDLSDHDIEKIINISIQFLKGMKQ